MIPAVFLDRDGVLNEPVVRQGKPYPPRSLSELRVIAGADAALRRLKAAGYLLVVVTNQPDVGRGTQTRAAVEEIHRTLAAALPLDDVFVCYHGGHEGCSCRKPLPGMLLEAARRHAIDLSASFLIGDRWRDIDAGHAAGCRTVLIDYGYQERPSDHPPDFRAASLAAAAGYILACTQSATEPRP